MPVLIFICLFFTAGYVGATPTQECVQANSSVRREMPEICVAEQIIQVTINVMPSECTACYVVEDKIPTGWEVSGISDGGVFDSINNKVKFGLFFDSEPRTLTYQVKAHESDNATFSGTASFDGINVNIGGNNSILIGSCMRLDEMRIRNKLREISQNFDDLSGMIGDPRKRD